MRLFANLTDEQFVTEVCALHGSGSLVEHADVISDENARRRYPLCEHEELNAEVRQAAEEKRLADSRRRGIPVVKPKADVCVFTDRRLLFDQLRTRRSLRVRHRGPRAPRPAAQRVRGSRRSLSRSSSRGGDSGDDPDEPEPERGHPRRLNRRPR